MRLALLLLGSVALNAAEFRLSAGLADSQVLQRNAQNSADISIGGTAEGLAGKTIEARVLSSGKAIKGWSWKPVATVHGATWTGTINGIPTGGPYTIEFRSRVQPPLSSKTSLSATCGFSPDSRTWKALAIW